MATAAENRPVYDVSVYARDSTTSDTWSHEYEDSVGVLLPAVGHLVVFFFRNPRVYEEEWPRTVTEVGFSLP